MASFAFPHDTAMDEEATYPVAGKGAVYIEKAGGVVLDLGVPAQVDTVDAIDPKLSSRVYHDEHFAHGKLQPSLTEISEGGPANKYAKGYSKALTGPLSGVPEQPIRHSTTTLRNVPGGQNLSNAVSMGTPMPKWPANWQSAAFEAVSIKKSYILSPPEIYAECAHHGDEKAKFAWYKLLILCVIAGCYVGFGFTLCLMVGGTLSFAPGIGTDDDTNLGLFKLIFGAVGFPFAFSAIVVCGAELYTSLCTYMTCAWWEGKVTGLTVLRMLVVSWCGNFAGCVIFVGLIHAAEIWPGKDRYMILLAEEKVHHPWWATFFRGIFANWLVGIATWMANAAQDMTGKAVAIWLPIAAFAMIGFEHCIANQFILPMAIIQGANITAKQFVWNNLIPATLGNYVGGAVCIATTYALIYGRTPLRIGTWWTVNVTPRLPWAKKNS